MKHKHYEMIMAKAANMELIVISKRTDGKWRVVAGCPEWFRNRDYFLCLPQHNEDGQCLHWLNGGAIESNETKSWVEVDSLELCTSHWYDGHFFMHEHEEFRIKANKEKRFIASFPWGGNQHYVTPKSFPAMRELNEYVDMHYGKRNLMQVHEIEVEV